MHITSENNSPKARIMADNTEEKKSESVEDTPLLSVHTTSLPSVLEQLRISVLVSTYQAGKLIVVRSEGNSINTHFRNFQVPMGVALHNNRIAIGCKKHV